MVFKVKCNKIDFERIGLGEATFWLGECSGIQKGDTITLQEWDPKASNATVPNSGARGYTNEERSFKVGYVDALGSRLVVSLLPMPSAKAKSKKA
jgi:hypothetical protein